MSKNSKKTPAIFLDRDGVINELIFNPDTNEIVDTIPEGTQVTVTGDFNDVCTGCNKYR